MRGVNFLFLRIPFCLLLLLWLALLEGHKSSDLRKVVQTAEHQQETRAKLGGIQGSWGTWGTWSTCSSTCGNGIQQQTRHCLSIYTQPQNAFRVVSSPQQQPGLIISALQPTVSLHSDTDRLTNSLRRGELSKAKQTRPAGRRRLTPIIPGIYGYGRAPYVAPLQTDKGQKNQRIRQRRSAASGAPHFTPRLQGGHRSNSFDLSTQFHPYSVQLKTHRPQNNPVWAPLYQPEPGSHSQVQQKAPSGSEMYGQQHQQRPYSPLPTSFCVGEHAHFRICSNHACPPSNGHIRAAQCSSYNQKPFMGRLYEWEPFSDVPEHQHCELNCRAVGYRFYMRKSDQVIDGTPCGQNETSFCVAGTCMSPGCDGYLGSEKVMDRCGICGGDNSTCRIVSGVFERSLSRIGYHKIVEIPEGAIKINVTEMAKSRNYLALRSRSGQAIINGDWAIDRPGRYEGVGTVFTYRRPNEISSTAGESLHAEGPTNEILEIYMIFQQPNPGVHYEYRLSTEHTASSQQEENAVKTSSEYEHQATTQDRTSAAGQERDSSSMGENIQPPKRTPDYNWKLAGATECSASCGQGFRYSIFNCMSLLNQAQVSDTFCDSSKRPAPQKEACNLQSCPAFWDIGEWSECSKTCGLGKQHRQVLCRQIYANHTLNVHTSHCQDLERPETSITCQLKICSEWQIHSEWTACSVPCGLGQRSRTVRCVSNEGDFVPDEECNMNLRPVDVENCDMGACAKSWFYTQWGRRCSAECGMGVRTRGVLCLTNHIGSLPLEGCGHERPANSQVCNNGPCESRTEWFSGPWSECSAECGTGLQQRSVVCLMKTEEGFTVMPPYECSSLERPLSQQSCNQNSCGGKWYHTDWSGCSKTCEGGFRVREVRCLLDNMLPSINCNEQQKPAEKEDCSPEPCAPEIDEKCRDKYFNCNVVVQARLCVYDYYKITCCASCSRGRPRVFIQRGRS